MRCAFLVALIGLTGCSSRPLETVDHVDLPRYMGTWHEIARLPAFFQRDCYNAEARYTLREDGKVDVVNTCETFDGDHRQSRGTATVIDTQTNAKLKVVFDNFFAQLFTAFSGANYYIIHLEDDYSVAVVGIPSRDYLWILSRDTTMPDDQYEILKALCAERGFPVEDLIRNSEIAPAGKAQSD